MRLALALLRKNMPNGNIWTGKHKFIRKVTPQDRANLIQDIQREEVNMFLLRHPYLSEEQTRGHVAHLNKHDKWIQEKRIAQTKPSVHVRLEDRLGHLRHADSWEV